MSLWSDLRSAIRQMIVVQERVERLVVEIEKTKERLLDQDRRLTRLETLISAAQRRAPPA